MPIEMTIARFRTLMLVSLALLLGAIAADGVALHQAGPLGAEGATWSTEATIGVVFALFCLVSSVAGFIGMFLLRRWGRALSLIMAVLLPVVGIAITVAAGSSDPLPSGMISPQLLELATLGWGAVLALAYWSPVASHFAARRPLTGTGAGLETT